MMENDKALSTNVRHSSRLAALMASGQKRPSFDSLFSKKRRRSDSLSPCILQRRRLCRHKLQKLVELCKQHEKHVTEEFFLNHEGNMLDFASWCANPPLNFLAHLKSSEFRIDDLVAEAASLDEPTNDVVARASSPKPVVAKMTRLSPPATVSPSPPVSPVDSSKIKAESSAAPIFPATSSAASSSPLLFPTSPREDSGAPTKTSDSVLANDTSVSALRTVSNADSTAEYELASTMALDSTVASSPILSVAPRLNAINNEAPVPSPSSSVTVDTKLLVSEKNIERAAKQEASVLRRIAELRRNGLWSAKRLPKCMDPLRNKTHWDYLLEEMQWMATDFQQERKWKRHASRKIGMAAAKQKKELDDRERKIELEREKELKRISSFIAREVKQFWNNIQKVVEYKTENIIDAKKKRALDRHLEFIVGQTEKYSTLISEGLNKPTSVAASIEMESTSDEKDIEFTQDQSSDDDETTIARAEMNVDEKSIADEVAMLQKESEMDVDDLLKSLPPGYFENNGEEFESSSLSSRSEEDEVEHLEEENIHTEDASSRMSFDQQQDAESSQSINFAKLQSANSEERQLELTQIAEAAERLQPKGFTLDSTSIVTKQPFLLRHDLREYQRVGLDWLVTLYDKKLNGILADEMGLGKTIQTIALLAHLACEKSNWGPHLIIVPTTVLLNWEMECKKWCPAFKILTYYGSIKDRREKRKGWSKKNSFHICITSYKLVLQDHLAFRRKRWQYLILDEAQNIKNFKSMRWQMLLNFRTERRLLLTGTPLQNSLMELWSLMHFLMPHVFGSHKDFREWFSNPLTGMIEGTQEFNEQTVKRLHKVLRPFLLRRLKSEVEKQLPKKFEHLIMCQLSKRQRFLYEDFMSRATTKNQLASGNVMGVMNILMQLRKVCNHPFLFEPRPIVSPFVMPPLTCSTAGLICGLLDRDAARDTRLPLLIANESLSKVAAERIHDLQVHEMSSENIWEGQPESPLLRGFTFESPATLSQPQQSASATSDNIVKRLQFVIPSQVAQNMDLKKPFFLQMGTPSGLKLIPVLFPRLSDQLLERLGLSSCDPSKDVEATCVASTSFIRSCEPQAAKAPPVLRLVPQSAHRHTQTAGRAGEPSLQATFVRNSRIPGTVAALDSQPQKPGVISAQIRLFPHVTECKTAKADLPPTQQQQFADASMTPSTSAARHQPSTSHSQTIGKPCDPAPSVKRIKREPVEEIITESPSPAVFDVPSMRRSKIQQRVNACLRLILENRRRCRNLMPVYGQNLTQLCNVWQHCRLPPHSNIGFEERFDSLKPLLDRFVVTVPAVKSSGLTTLNACCSRRVESSLFDALLAELKSRLNQTLTLVHPVEVSRSAQFPELRLIEYDCGKLQNLSALLRQLKPEGHRCLIFTQMSRMLDILESFLSYHGYTYLRLDGATRIEHRQILMERFNQDQRIFCFILSTRSGGIGVNLTGADTVIFYDSDWNPTMDAQAQDRCHRIGQTRDVHIYRLISEKTVEENILKKSMQKRKLGEIAIEEGGFTCEFFKKSNILDIFDLVEADSSKVSVISQQELEQAMTKVEDDDRDVAAARLARAEATAELAEFDESQDLSNQQNDELDPDVLKVEQEMKHLTDQLKPIERYAVRYIEAIAEPDRFDEVRQTEEEIESHKRKWEEAQELARCEEEQRKRRMREEEFDLTYEYSDSTLQMVSSEDSSDIMLPWCPPTPPLSDYEEFDLYYEPALSFLYERTPMLDSELPSYYVEPLPHEQTPLKSPKRDLSTSNVDTCSLISNSTISAAVSDQRVNSAQYSKPPSSSPQRQVPQVPSYTSLSHLAVSSSATSLTSSGRGRHPTQFSGTKQFSAQSHARASITGSPLAVTAKQTPSVSRRPLTPPIGVTDLESSEVSHEWNMLEDFSLYNGVAKLQQMPYGTPSFNEGHGVNWSFVSECVTASCGRYRSPKQCHLRYESLLQLMTSQTAVGGFNGVSFDGALSSASLIGKKRKADSGNKRFRVRTSSQLVSEGQGFFTSHVEQRFRTAACLRIKHELLGKRAGISVYGKSLDPHLQRNAWNAASAAYQPALKEPIKLVEAYDDRLRMEEKRKQLLQQQQLQIANSAAARLLPLTRSQLPIHQQPQNVMIAPTANTVVTLDNFPGFISRPISSPSIPINVQSPSIYRQVTSQAYKVQRTPPGTPGSLAAYPQGAQTGVSTYHQLAALSGQAQASANTMLGPVLVQASPQLISHQQAPADFVALIKQQQQQHQTSGSNLRFHTVSTAGHRQKIQVAPQGTQQFGTGSFLVSAEVAKPQYVGHHLTSNLIQPGGRFASSAPLRGQLQVTPTQQQQLRNQSSAPRLQPVQGTMRPSNMGSVHLVSQAGRISTSGVASNAPAPARLQITSGVPTQFVSPSILPSGSAGGSTAGIRNSIPSVSSILPSSSSRIESAIGPTIIIQQSHQHQQQQQHPEQS